MLHNTTSHEYVVIQPRVVDKYPSNSLEVSYHTIFQFHHPCPRLLPHLLPLGVHVVLDDDGGLAAAHASLGQTVRVDLLGQHDQGGLSGLADLLEAVFELVVVDGGVVAHGADGGQFLQNLVVADLGLDAACEQDTGRLVKRLKVRHDAVGWAEQRSVQPPAAWFRKRKRWKMECMQKTANRMNVSPHLSFFTVGHSF